jgi:hypothetical protein
MKNLQQIKFLCSLGRIYQKPLRFQYVKHTQYLGRQCFSSASTETDNKNPSPPGNDHLVTGQIFFPWGERPTAKSLSTLHYLLDSLWFFYFTKNVKLEDVLLGAKIAFESATDAIFSHSDLLSRRSKVFFLSFFLR